MATCPATGSAGMAWSSSWRRRSLNALPGAFIRTGLTDDTTAALIAATAKKPQATICLLSALSIHDLTDEIPTRSDIALPRGSQPPRITISPVRWHRFHPATFEVGRTQQSLPGGGRIGLYSPERTILDVFRLRHDWGADLAHAALRRWLARQGSSPATLLSMAEKRLFRLERGLSAGG